MKNIFLIAKREFLTQVKKKSFIILTLLAPLLIIGFGFLVGMMMKANETEHTINVIDKSGLFTSQLKSNAQVSYVYVSPNSEKQILAGLKDMPDVDGLLVLAPLTNNDFAKLEQDSKLIVNKKIGFEAKQNIVSDLSDVIRKEKIKSLNVSEAKIKELDESFHLKTESLSEENKVDSDLIFGVKYALGMILMYVTFMFIMIYGVRVMRSVLEEKNNRVVEIIISSVKPFELMMGKIIGVTLVALTQFSVWITMSLLGTFFLSAGFSTVAKPKIPGEDPLGKTDLSQIASEISASLWEMNVPLIIFVFLFFFLFGYIFYSSIYAAIGSAVDNETETQQFTLFAIIPLMIGVYGSFTMINNPDGPTGFWLSIIPFTSPVAMVARIPFGVPAWQIALSMSLLIFTTILMVFVAGKVYRVGILMYGNKASMKEIWKWIRTS